MRFLKKEWDDTEIPRQSLLRARNRAWQRLQQGQAVPRRRLAAWPWLLPPGAAAAALLALLLWSSWPGSGVQPLPPLPLPQPPPTELAGEELLPAPDVLGEASADPRWAGQLDEAGPAKAGPGSPELERPGAPPVMADASRKENLETKTKIVFRLPRSGVRMIWMTQTSQGE